MIFVVITTVPSVHTARRARAISNLVTTVVNAGTSRHNSVRSMKSFEAYTAITPEAYSQIITGGIESVVIVVVTYLSQKPASSTGAIIDVNIIISTLSVYIRQLQLNNLIAWSDVPYTVRIVWVLLWIVGAVKTATAAIQVTTTA